MAEQGSYEGPCARLKNEWMWDISAFLKQIENNQL